MLCDSYSAPTPQDVLNLVYYSHIPTMALSLMVGIFVYFRSGRSLTGSLFLGIVLSFFLWLLCDVVAWVVTDSDTVMFVWSFFGMLYVLVSLSSLYFVRVFLHKKDVSFGTKLLFGLAALPSIALAATPYSLPDFNLRVCGADENFSFIAYYYEVGLVASLWILATAFRAYRHAPRELRKQIVFLTVGIEFFLLSFFLASAGISFLIQYGYLDNYNLESYGLFGMPVFLASIAYLIVRYRAFSIRLFGTQALIVALLFLSGFQLFISQGTIGFAVAVVVFVLTLCSSILLFRSFRMESRKLALELANRNLRRVDRAKTEFIDIVSHQLRTPVSIIKGTVSVLLEDERRIPSRQRRQLLEGAYRKTVKLNGIVEDIMKVARVMAGDYRRFEKVDAGALLAELTQDFESSFQEKNIRYSLEVQPNLPPLLGEADALRDVFSNLLDNALKYTPSTKPAHESRAVREERGEIAVSVGKKSDTLLFSIRDNGIGIPKAELPLVFRKFKRASNASGAYTDGTGLGLYIVKEIVRAHHGKIWVESELGKGTAFFVSLPAGKRRGKASGNSR
jgi:signal transduction histidine kinase